jgi:putative membrane protein
MENAVKHYSSLFKLPSYRRVISLMALVCFGVSLLSTISLFGYPDGLIDGLFLAFSLFFANSVLDYVISMLILREDPIFSFRRTAAVSLVCMVLWLFFGSVGVVVATSSGLLWWIRLCLLGFSAVLIFRLIVLNAASRMGYKRVLTAAFLQPVLCMIPFLALWTKIGLPPTMQMGLFFAFSIGVALLSSFSFIFLLNRVGKQTLGVPSFSLLKAFLLNWVLDLNAPFEELLEGLGEEQNVEVTLMEFISSKPKAAIVVPSVHPGPFKNVGSSILPSMIKNALEKSLGCTVCVPHGLFGHELDLASQSQNQKIINSIIHSKNAESLETKASPFVSVSNGAATACCQIFGNLVFISFTLAPETIEDLPKELGFFVQQEAKKHDLACSAVVNAHNSINRNSDMQEALGSLQMVASSSLKKAASLGHLPFDVGAATVIPKEFTLSDGMGPGGTTAVAIQVGEQKTAYVVIDGNNMVSGLREQVLSALHSVGFDECEVFTTDTHAVNAVILSERGYHPVGEAMDNEKLIDYIKGVALAALADLEPVRKVYCHRIVVPKVKVIGAKQLETLCLLTDKAIHKAKKLAPPIFMLSGLVLMLVLLFV